MSNMATTAWEITEEDVSHVIAKHRAVTEEILAKAYDTVVAEGVRIEKAALCYTNFEEQFYSALDEIENVLIEGGFLAGPKKFAMGGSQVEKGGEPRKFFKTILQVEILSEGPYAFTSLGESVYDITRGDCSGITKVISSTEMSAPDMAKELVAQGSDPDFFHLTEDGEDSL